MTKERLPHRKLADANAEIEDLKVSRDHWKGKAYFWRGRCARRLFD